MRPGTPLVGVATVLGVFALGLGLLQMPATDVQRTTLVVLACAALNFLLERHDALLQEKVARQVLRGGRLLVGAAGVLLAWACAYLVTRPEVSASSTDWAFAMLAVAAGGPCFKGMQSATRGLASGT